MTNAADDLLRKVGTKRFHTVLADPPWRFQKRTGKVAPEHKRLNRYSTMTLDAICEISSALCTRRTALQTACGDMPVLLAASTGRSPSTRTRRAASCDRPPRMRIRRAIAVNRSGVIEHSTW